MEIVPDKPSKSRKGAGGNHKKNSPAFKALAEKRAAEAKAAQPLAETPTLVESRVDSGPIKKPVYLIDPIAVIVWGDVLPSLVESGRLGQVDASLIAAYCMETAVYMRSLERQASLFESTTENRQKLLLDQAQGALKRMLQLAEQLGIGMKSHMSVAKPQPPSAAKPASTEEKPAEVIDEEKERRKHFIRTGKYA